MRVRPRVSLLLALLLAIPFANNLDAQTTTSGGLTGVVTDQSNAVVPGAAVEITDIAKGATQTTKTDGDGVYRFFFLAPGRYALSVKQEGFQKEGRVVNVPLGPPVTVNVALKIAAKSTNIEVTGEAPLLQAENGDVSTAINQKQIAEVPNPGNDLTYVAQTAPGAIMNTDNPFGNSQFAILGMPSTANLFIVDGMSENDNGSNSALVGPLGLLLGQNQVQEVTIVSTGYSAQFGGSAGAILNYITKSGSNKFHGNAQYFWNGRLLNANNWFNNAFDQPRPFDNANQWAASLGGPIKKDKLFFFLDSEGIRLVIPQTYFMLIPSPQFEAATIANIDSRFGATSASDAFYKQIFGLYNGAPGASSATPGGFNPGDPTGCTGFSLLAQGMPCAMHFLSSRGRRSGETLTSGRVDWRVGAKDLAFLRLQYDSGLGAFLADPISSVFDVDEQMQWWQGQLVEVHTFSPSAASQFLLAGTFFSGLFGVRNTSRALSAFPTALLFTATGTFSNLGSFEPTFAFPSGRRNTQYQVSEDVVKGANKHKFGIGGQLNRYDWSERPNRTAVVGSLLPQTLDAFYQGGVNPSTPHADFTQLTQAFTSQTTLPISFLGFGLYAEDEWHARANFTLTAAVRAEYYSNPTCKDACFARLRGTFEAVTHDPSQPYNQAILTNQSHALQNTDGILWSPRLSFAWQPLSVSNNSVLRGGVGLFYGPLPGFILDAFSNNTPLYNSYTLSGDNLSPNEKASLFKDAAASNAAFLEGFAAGQTLAQIQATTPTFSPPAINAGALRMHSPQFQRWSLEWQQTFGANTSVSIGYYGHHGIRELVQNPNANAFGFGSLPASLCNSPPTPPCADPRFSEALEFNTNAISNYNGMVASVKHQFTHWTRGLFQANYAYGHAFDETSNGGLFGFTFVSSITPQNPNNLRGAYGSAEYDARHSFNASYIMEVPIKALLHGRGLDSLFQGWQISGTIFARTGLPYTVFDFAESTFLQRNNYFGMLYAVPVGPLGSGGPCGQGAALPLVPQPCQPPQVLANGNPNPQANFIQVGCETGFDAGTLPGPNGPCSGPVVSFAQGRNRFRGPNYFNTDLAVMKNTSIPHWEKATFGIGLQFFNLFNHPNFGFPDNFSSDPIFGQIQYLEASPTGILGSGLGDLAPRMIQLKVELQF